MIPGARILVLGADGFIGRHILFRLRERGFVPVASARRVTRLDHMGFETFRMDLSSASASDPATWARALDGIDAVINAAGLLTGGDAAFEAVHVTAPGALYEAAGDRPCLLLSAVGIDEADTPFARFRRAGETVAQDAGAIILRAGLVLGDTSYGGSSLARGLAAFPGVTPVIGGGKQAFNPVHANDLADVMIDLLAREDAGLHEVGGPETLTLGELLGAYRGWLGLRKVRKLTIPLPLARLTGRIGDAMRLGPISATAVDQLAAGVLATPTPGLPPTRGFSEFLGTRPAGTQDLWHARLYLLRPILRLTMAVLWLVSGIIGLLLPADQFLPLVDTTLPDGALIAAARAGGLVDLTIAAALLRGWRPRLMAFAQAAMVTGYSVGFTLLAPALWLLPLGGLLKNLPILALIAVLSILEDER